MAETRDDSLLQRFQGISGVSKPSGNMALFLEHAPPDVGERFLDLLNALGSTPHLDARTRALIRVVVCMVVGHELGVKAWARAALGAGATAGEVVESFYSVIPQVGAIPIIRMLPVALEVVDEAAATPASGEGAR